MISQRNLSPIPSKLLLRATAVFAVVVLWTGSVGIAPAGDPPSDASSTAAEDLGKRIFFEGEGNVEGGITAVLGAGGFSVPASAVPCANCHGDDGLGRPEGGVEPSNITWPHLTKPYGLRHRSGRRHPAYDETTFARALRAGLDPAGTPLDAEMPKYRMSDDEVGALIAYLKQLGSELDPGLTAEQITIGVVVAQEGQAAPFSDALRALVEAYFAEVSDQGGIYGRRIAPEFIDDAGAGPSPATELTDEIFAAIALPTSIHVQDRAAAFGRADIPVVIPFDTSGGGAATTHRNVFYLLGAMAEQTRALLSYGKQYLGFEATSVAVVVEPNAAGEAIADAASRQAERFGWPAPTVIRATAADTAQSVADQLRSTAAEAVVYAAQQPAVARVADHIAAAAWAPYLLIAGQVGGADVLRLPGVFVDRVFISFSNVPTSGTRNGFKELETLRRKAGINAPPNALMAATLSAAKVLVEGLRVAGSSLSRRKLLDALQQLHLYETGLTPAISFGPSRRTGADGVYILAADVKNHSFLPGAAWIRVDSRL